MAMLAEASIAQAAELARALVKPTLVDGQHATRHADIEMGLALPKAIRIESASDVVERFRGLDNHSARSIGLGFRRRTGQFLDCASVLHSGATGLSVTNSTEALFGRKTAVARVSSTDTISPVSPWLSRERLRRNLDVRFGFVGECLRGYAWKNCSTDECQCRNGNRNAALDLLSMSHGRTSLMVRRA